MLAVFWLGACTSTSPRGGGDIVVVGDSVLAWNGRGGASIPDVIGRTLGREVTDKAVPGAQFDNASGIAGAVGFDIQKQYPGGRWNWIVVNGGANDVIGDCKCRACDAVLDGLITADGKSGSIPAFLTRLRGSGAQVLWMGYYAGNGKGSFNGCRDELVTLDARIALFADATPGVFFADSEDVLDPKDPANFASDNTHPSAKGSATIGAYLSRVISQAETRSQ
jgi:lysophospholipase L1-like esterase